MSGSPTPQVIEEERSGSLQSPGNPRAPLPCSGTPAVTPLPWSWGEGSRPPGWQNRRLTAGKAISGLNSTASTRAVYASQGLLPGPTQDSLPAAWPSLAGRDFVTRRVATKGF